MTLSSTPLTEVLKKVQSQDVAKKIEDETYLQNASNDLKLAKAFDRMDQAALAYKHGMKAVKTIDTLVTLRKEQGYDYQLMLAPFYFKLGDYLATFIELNTDEFGNVKPLPDEAFDSENEDEADGEEGAESEDPREEAKDEPVITEEPMTINTC